MAYASLVGRNAPAFGIGLIEQNQSVRQSDGRPGDGLRAVDGTPGVLCQCSHLVALVPAGWCPQMGLTQARPTGLGRWIGGSGQRRRPLTAHRTRVVVQARGVQPLNG
jgi:hypothetical protein